MRKVDVVRPPIKYVVFSKGFARPYEIAWFIDAGDAEDFINSQRDSEEYEIAEVRR